MAVEPSLGAPMAPLPVVGVKLHPRLCPMKENLALEHPEHWLLQGVHLLAAGVLGRPIPDVEVMVAVLDAVVALRGDVGHGGLGSARSRSTVGPPEAAVLQAEGRGGAAGRPRTAVLPCFPSQLGHVCPRVCSWHGGGFASLNLPPAESSIAPYKPAVSSHEIGGELFPC